MEKTGKITSKQILNSTVTINRQPYRHVDYVTFEDGVIIDSLLSGWRKTGFQRGGFLIGTYTKDKSIPLGIKAKVCGIYEPPQQSTEDKIVLLKDPNSEKFDRLLRLFGLQRVGFIWTSIKTNEKKEVIYDRNPECPLFCKEIIRMGKHQSKYPNPWNDSDEKRFGSKFVSVLCYGSQNGGIEFDAFQISNQGVALIQDDVIKVAKEDPINFKVRKSNEKYIYPELQYSDVNEYGKNVTKKADPFFPALFFIIGVRSSTPKNPKPSFPKFSFPTYNHIEKPGWEAVRDHFNGKRGKEFIDSFLDFQLLLFFFDELEEDNELIAKIAQRYRGETVSESELSQSLEKNIANNGSKKTHNFNQ